MARRLRVRLASPLVLVLTSVVLLGCRASTVSVAYAPRVGDRYSYRYEIEATITRTVEGSAPVVTHVDTELTADQVVEARTARGARIRLRLIRDGGPARTAVAIVDRAGSFEGIEVGGVLDTVVPGADEDAVVPTHLPGPPDRPLAPGDRWSIDGGRRTGEGRLDRLGVIDGQDVAVVRTTATEDLARSGRAGASTTALTGRVQSGSTTSYDLADGAIRRSRSHSDGTVRARVQPPPGVDAEPVTATFAFQVTVRVTRTA